MAHVEKERETLPHPAVPVVSRVLPPREPCAPSVCSTARRSAHPAVPVVSRVLVSRVRRPCAPRLAGRAPTPVPCLLRGLSCGAAGVFPFPRCSIPMSISLYHTRKTEGSSTHALRVGMCLPSVWSMARRSAVVRTRRKSHSKSQSGEARRFRWLAISRLLRNPRLGKTIRGDGTSCARRLSHWRYAAFERNQMCDD